MPGAFFDVSGSFSEQKAGPFAAEQPTDVSHLSQVVRCALASDEAARGPSWPSAIVFDWF